MMKSIEKANEKLMKWLGKHPGIKYSISYRDGNIFMWQETANGHFLNTTTYELSKDELKGLPFNEADILESAFKQLKEEKKDGRGEQKKDS